MSKKIKFSDAFLFICIFLIAFILYTLTLYPTVALSDSGELATVAKVLGIPHPTGYPLYALLGRLFVMIFGFLPVSLATNLMSAIFGALASAILYLFLRVIGARKYTALLGATLFMVSRIMWEQAVLTEVYTLAIFLYLSALTTLFSWTSSKNPRWLVLSAFFWGLSFAHHMSVILFVPAIIYLLIVYRRQLNFRITLVSALFFVLGLSVYLYLPIRASLNPLMNWGAPSTFERFFRHLTGWQYRVWMFSRTTEQLKAALADMVKIIVKNWNLPSLVLLVLLWVLAAIRRTKLLWVMLLIIVFDAIYALNYTIPDISPYYLPVVLALSVGVLGIDTIRLRFIRTALVVLVVVAVVFSAQKNFRICDHSDDWSAWEFGANVLSPVPANSLIMVSNWDMYATARYLQVCHDIRNDVAILDFNLLRRSWYVEEISKAPRFAFALQKIMYFRDRVLPFERGEKFDPMIIQDAFDAMIDELLMRWPYPVYAHIAELSYMQKYKGIPEGLTFRVDEGGHYRFLPPWFFEHKNTIRRRLRWDERQKVVYGVYPAMFMNRAVYLVANGRLAEAEDYLQTALLFSPLDPRLLKPLLALQIDRNNLVGAKRTWEKLMMVLTPGEIQAMRTDIISRFGRIPWEY